MKVLIVGQFVEPPFAEGAVNVVLNWSRALSVSNVDIEVIGLSSHLSGTHQFFDITFRYVKTKNPRFQNSLTDLFSIQKAIIKNSKNFDIIHFASNADGVSYIPCLLMHKLRGKKIVNSYNTTREISTSFLTGHFFDAFTVPSQRVFDEFNSLLYKKLKIISPCVDTNLFQPQNKLQAREKLGIAPDAFVIFTVGHFKRGRRLLPFLDVVEKLVRKRKNVHLLIGWTGHGNEDDIQEFFSIIKKKNFVTIVPPTDNINVYYNAIDVYVLTATFDHVIETPMSLIEALSSGVPALSFDINAASEIIENGINGFLIEDGDFHEMMNKLDQLISNNLLLRTLSKSARAIVSKNYSYEKASSQLKHLYSGLLEK